MINPEDIKITKGLVISALVLATNDLKTYYNIKNYVEKAFDIVVKELEDGIKLGRIGNDSYI